MAQVFETFIERLATCNDARSLREVLAKREDFCTPELVGALCQEVRGAMRNDLKRARALADAAVRIAAVTRDVRSRGEAARVHGHVLYLSGSYARAIKSYERSVQSFRRIRDGLELARTLSSALQTLIYLGRYDQAFAWAEEARIEFMRSRDTLRLARLDSNLANILHRQERFQEALKLYRRAHRELQKHGEYGDATITLRNMAVCHMSLSEFSAAFRAYRRARSFCERHQLPLLAAEVDYNIAYLHYLRGDYIRAIAAYRETQQYVAQEEHAYHRAVSELDQSDMYLELNLESDAARLSEGAAETFQRLGMRYERAKALTNLAIARQRKGEFADALHDLSSARRLFRQEGNKAWAGVVDLYRALVLYRMGEHHKARRLCEEARRQLGPSALVTKTALCDLLLSRLDLHFGRNAAARSRCAEVIASLGQLDSSHLAFHSHLLMAEIHETENEQEAARHHYGLAREMLERLWSRLSYDELRVAFASDKLFVFESLFRLSVRDSIDPTEAWDLAEHAKSRSLAEMVAFRMSETPRADSTSEQVRALRRELAWRYHRLDTEERRSATPAASVLEKLRRDVAAKEEEFALALRNLPIADPNYASLQNGVISSPDHVRECLPDDCDLIEYYVARGRLYALLLTAQNFEVIDIADANRLEHPYRMLRFQFSKIPLASRRPVSSASFGAVMAHLQSLYRIVFDPIRSRLKSRRLIVVPHGVLHSIPFHALHDGARHLLDLFTISYAPSATVYSLCCSRPAGTGKGSLVLASPDHKTPHVLREAKEVAAQLPEARLFTGRQASDRRLRQGGPSCRYIHIATHGIFRQENPMFSAVRLGLSRMSVHDFHDLRLSADLVTLSGCATALHGIAGGDEQLGLIRGLLVAGARSVLSSLWDVNDKSTALFMSNFYKSLASGAGKADAARDAAIAVRQEYPHPYFWAPFTLTGQHQ